MDQADLVAARASTVLESQGLIYGLVGSYGIVPLYGEPRFTHDIDIVISLTPDAAVIGYLRCLFPRTEFDVSSDSRPRGAVLDARSVQGDSPRVGQQD